MNTCTRLDSVVGVLNVDSYYHDTLPSQVPIWKMEHESTAEMNSLLLAEISGPLGTSIIGVGGRSKNKNNFREIIFVIVTEL